MAIKISSFRLGAATEKQLRKLAKKRGQSMAAVIRALVLRASETHSILTTKAAAWDKEAEAVRAGTHE